MNSNLIIERELKSIDEISDLYGYDSNIRHLLYIIIQAFVIKYGISKEKFKSAASSFVLITLD